MELNKLKITARRLGYLEKMGIESIESLLTTYPSRYQTIEVVPFSQWELNQSVCFEGLICQSGRVFRFGRNRSFTKFTVLSWNEELEITLYNRPWASQFSSGKTITLFGVYKGQNKVVVSSYNFHPLQEQLGISPVYSLPKGLRQKEFQDLLKKALPYVDELEDITPERYRKAYRLLSHRQALTWIHFPQSEKAIQLALRTLKYEEFLAFQCVMQTTCHQEMATQKNPKIFDQKQIDAWVESLPYTLTIDQQSAIDVALEDMHSSKTMFRLVQGDVGCGKTVVAQACLYACFLSGQQAAFLAPTEILARQHYEKCKAMDMDVHLYVSSLPGKEKEAIRDGMKSGEMQVFVGTHALFQEAVEFQNLGLVIADEQQRFGVRQRRSLLEKGENVDFMMMSATPIPRTYAHFIYGDMDITNIKTMPPQRKPVETHYVPGSSMKPVLKDVLDVLEQGHQCYVVCAAIDDNPEMSIRSVRSIYEGMKKTLKDWKVGLLHGQLTSEEKEATMQKFARHELDILISTTVIEVGIDVPNATFMVIYDAHRFGLSTLHQLRGRVARSKEQGVCILLSDTKDPQAIERLKKMEELKDGFTISDYDLQIRGPGDFLGVRQSGLPNFILGDLQKDKAMMEVCVKDAKEILARQEDKAMLQFIQASIAKAEYFD